MLIGKSAASMVEIEYLCLYFMLPRGEAPKFKGAKTILDAFTLNSLRCPMSGRLADVLHWQQGCFAYLHNIYFYLDESRSGKG
jgi:hypothetical protein